MNLSFPDSQLTFLALRAKMTVWVRILSLSLGGRHSSTEWDMYKNIKIGLVLACCLWPPLLGYVGTEDQLVTSE